MKCPRCQSPLPTPVRLNAEGFLVCTACGSKLRPRPPIAASPEAPPPAAAEEASGPEDPLASLTEPAAPEGAPDAAAPDAVPAPAAPAEPPPLVPKVVPEPGAGEPPGRPRAGAATAVGDDPGFVAIMAELKAIRRAQDRLLDLLSGGARPALPGSLPGLTPVGPGARAAAQAPGVRTQNRKTALLIDDDLAARFELVAALREAEVPVREAGSGNEGLTLISQERPDVIVIEAELGGDMTSQDTITLIKATMEWIDIPIVLYTRLPIADQEEARTSYAADDFVLKGPGAAAAIVARVVALFRR